MGNRHSVVLRAAHHSSDIRYHSRLKKQCPLDRKEKSGRRKPPGRFPGTKRRLTLLMMVVHPFPCGDPVIFPSIFTNSLEFLKSLTVVYINADCYLS